MFYKGITLERCARDRNRTGRETSDAKVRTSRVKADFDWILKGDDYGLEVLRLNSEACVKVDPKRSLVPLAGKTLRSLKARGNSAVCI